VRRDLAKRFGVDAFLIAAVADADRQSTGSVGYGSANGFGKFVWGMFGAANIERSSGNVQIAIIRADDGKVLMRGTGFAESQTRSLNRVLANIAADILENAFWVQR
jgi:hypothetical protein